MAQADPEAVVYIGKRAPKASELRTDQAVNRAKRTGQDVDTSKKWAGGQNKQHSAHKNTAVLDGETEELHHDKIGLGTGKLIAQARSTKGLTQKDLATKVNEKPHVINDYESGKAIPNQQILNKLERVLGVKLRGKDKGTEVVAKTPKKK